MLKGLSRCKVYAPRRVGMDQKLTGRIGRLQLRIAVSVGLLVSSSGFAAAGDPASWGGNWYGQLGTGSTTYSLAPVAVLTSGALAGKTVAHIGAGNEHSCALISEGRAYCWGSNFYGQLGTGSAGSGLVSAPAAVDVSGVLAGVNLSQIDGGYFHTCAVDSNGRAYCWGRNTEGQLGLGNFINSPPPAAVNMGGKTVTNISAGFCHTCALTSEGSAYCWGQGGQGQLGNGSFSSSSSPVPVTGGLVDKTVTNISAGFYHTCALTSDGLVYCWGYGANGQTGTPIGSTTVPVNVGGVLAGKRVIAIASGNLHTCAIDSGGVAYCWGYNDYGALGNPVLSNTFTPVPVDASGVLAGKTLSSVAAGGHHTCATDSTGLTYCWGYNGYGQLGNGSWNTSSAPVQVTANGLLAGKGVTELSLGFGHSLALLSDSAPAANAGPDVAVNEGLPVELDGSGSSPRGLALTYKWKQIPVSTVSLADTTSPTLRFNAPYVDANTTLSFSLTVTDSAGLSSDDVVNVTVKQSNNPPVADAGLNSTIREGARKTLDGSLSYDPDNDPITHYAWRQLGGPSVSFDPSDAVVSPSFVAPMGSAGQTLSFGLMVSDGKEASQPATVLINVVANSAPIANAGLAQSVDENTFVALSGGASTDPDGDSLSYSWTQISGPEVQLTDPTSATPSFTAPPVNAGGASLVFQLTVKDNDPANPKSATAQVAVSVIDVADPPNCQLAQPSAKTIWPPNHTLAPVSIIGVADSGASDYTLHIDSVTQDEPTNGLGDGDTPVDAVIVRDTPSDHVDLRAERAGNGDGRVYAVRFTASNGRSSCTGSVRVSAPQNRKTTAVDSGQNYTSTR